MGKGTSSISDGLKREALRDRGTQAGAWAPGQWGRVFRFHFLSNKKKEHTGNLFLVPKLQFGNTYPQSFCFAQSDCGILTNMGKGTSSISDGLKREALRDRGTQAGAWAPGQWGRVFRFDFLSNKKKEHTGNLFLVPKLQFGNTYPQSSALLAVMMWNSYQHGKGDLINFRRSEAGSSQG